MNRRTLKDFALATAWAAVCVLSGPIAAQAQDAETPTALPRTYALVAAVGQQLGFISQGASIGSHLSPYSRRSMPIAGDVLNSMAMGGLDQAVAKSDPQGLRVHFVLSGKDIDGLPPQQREEATINQVIAQLRDQPDRQHWYRIVVVTPAYRAADIDGMATRLEGLGVFMQPVRGGTFTTGEGEINLDRQAGERVRTPSDKEFRSQAFVAPFTYVEVWVLDPLTMTVLDRQSEFRNRKLGDPMAMRSDVFQGVSGDVMTSQLNALLGTTIGEAVAKTEVGLKRGTITVIEHPADRAASAP